MEKRKKEEEAYHRKKKSKRNIIEATYSTLKMIPACTSNTAQKLT